MAKILPQSVSFTGIAQHLELMKKPKETPRINETMIIWEFGMVVPHFIPSKQKGLFCCC